jgi:hypothetical protein
MHSDKGLYLAMRFQEGHVWNIKGWFWGKPLSNKSKVGTMWLNFTEEGTAAKRADDLQVSLSDLTVQNYGKIWAVVAPKSFIDKPAEVPAEDA